MGVHTARRFNRIFVIYILQVYNHDNDTADIDMSMAW
jgi:hypothetical protein